MHTLKIDSVRLSFNNRVILSSAYVSSSTGKISAILGRNGAGKSCLFKIALGVLKTDDASVTIDNQSYFYSKHKNKLITYLPQFNFIPKQLSLKKALENFDVPTEKLTSHFPSFIKLLKQKIKDFSGGERRLVEVCIIIFSNSLFSILDEPFSELMPLHIEKIKEILIAEKQHKGIIITDHLYKNAIDIADDISLLSGGNIYKITDIKELVEHGYISMMSNP